MTEKRLKISKKRGADAVLSKAKELIPIIEKRRGFFTPLTLRSE